MSNEQAEERTCATCGWPGRGTNGLCRQCYEMAYTPAPSEEPKPRCTEEQGHRGWLNCPAHGLSVSQMARAIGHPTAEPKDATHCLIHGEFYAGLPKCPMCVAKDAVKCRAFCPHCGEEQPSDGVNPHMVLEKNPKKIRRWTCEPKDAVKDEPTERELAVTARLLAVAEALQPFAGPVVGSVLDQIEGYTKDIVRRLTPPVKDEGFDAAYQFGDLLKDPSKWNLDPADCHLRVPVALVSQIESELARRSTPPLDVRKALRKFVDYCEEKYPGITGLRAVEELIDTFADELAEDP